MIGALTGLFKGGLTKPKVDAKGAAKKFQGAEEKQKQVKPKAAMVPETVKKVRVIVVKPMNPEKINTSGLGKTPLALEFESIFYRTLDIHTALHNRYQAKRKKAAAEKKAGEKKKRNLKERLSEMGKGLGKLPGASKVTGAIGSLWGAILKTLGILFAGWLLQYLPQILKFVEKFIDIAGKIVKVAAKIVSPLVSTLVWITKEGTKLFGMLVGVDPEEAQKNTFIKNVTEIQKKVPLIEAAFAAFAILKAKGKFTKGKTQPRSKPKTSKLGKKGSAARNAQARQLRQQRRAAQNAKKLNRFGRKTKAVVGRKLGRGVRGGLSKAGGALKGVGAKAGKLGGNLMKGFGKLAKFAKFPIIGPLIIAVTQIIAGEGIKKAAFMGLGAALGGGLGMALAAALSATGIGALLAPVVTIAGEGIGAFFGEVLYEGFMGKGWGAAKDKLVGTITGFFTGAGKMGKMVWKWITGGGLWGLIKNVAGGIGAVFKWIFAGPGGGGLLDLATNLGGGILKMAKYIFMPNGFIWDVLKGGGKVIQMIWNWFTGGGFMTMLKGMGGGAKKVLGWLWNVAIPAALKAAGNAGKALMEFFTGGMNRFVDTFPLIKFPTASIGSVMGPFFETIFGPVYDMKVIPKVGADFGKGDEKKWLIDPRRHAKFKFGLQSVRDIIEGMTYGIPDIMGSIFGMIPGLNKLVKDGKVEGMPDVSKLFWPPLFMAKHAISSFFPSGASSGTSNSGGSSQDSSIGSSSTGSPDDKKDDTATGITPTPDNSKGDDTVKGQGAAAASADASSISQSASYDKVGTSGGKGGIIPVPVGQMQSGGSGGQGVSVTAGSMVNKYEVINGFKKTMILSELYRG